ncbi:hypothetical protein LTR91_004085 [Friedmanniomyces endolithicus]|uniref:Histone H1 n=1 Tax=Friedmanniomyces endolithicus TaxID=329885 RepID=A0AAN6QYX7_9PEZI|nr:hypothetical protein LTR94_000595 [Friedmanniomyces endolithicus]KAK0791861.1 hypothetical protein LTR75_011626 [Friedmanniomyces endolithicus]KAK0815644.1 hypothetical protein LTR38_002290 [Friedmanniomyces endolithicus]KAK0857562.1 hypothetical protein LTR03_000595 [Friedmanniomyces endolithicus]KAK0873045.1 hypothetical protein LTS02_000981 [Friedmanniomyces endolithicus]
MSSAQGSIRQQVRVIVTSSSPPASISKRCGIQRTLADGSFVCSSRQALKKYVQANNNLSGVTDAQFSTQFNRALQRGSDAGAFARPKGPSGPVKLAAPTKAGEPAAPKPAATKAPKMKATTTGPAKPIKKAPAKKTTTTKKAPAKKATATKTKATKANTGKARKTPAVAPAVEDKPSVVLGKTKSGRITKSAQPQATATKKKAATSTKRKAPAKRATPKKTATPKSAKSKA